MKRTALVLTSILAASTLALPFAAQASDADGQYGLIDYKMGIASKPMAEAPQNAGVVAPNPSLGSDAALSQYGIADVKTGAAASVKTSDNTAALPVSEVLDDQAGLAKNDADAGQPGAVVTADGGAIGSIERIVPGEAADTVYIRVSDNIENRKASVFKIDVPKGSASPQGVLTLGYTMSGLLEILDAQV